MVLRERYIYRMEIKGVALVDPWQTYVFRTHNECLALINNFLILKRGQGKAHFCMSLLYGFARGCLYCPLDPQSFRTSRECKQQDWPQWRIIILTFGMLSSKTAMAFYPPSFISFHSNRMHVTTSSPSYILTLAEYRSPISTCSKNA